MIIDSNGNLHLPDDVQQIADIKLAVALIENLKIKGMISDEVFEKITQEAEKMIEEVKLNQDPEETMVINL